jgi:hypothetical protein
MIAGSQLNFVSASAHMVTSGCSSNTTCQANTCPRESNCKQEWRKTSCVCRNGYVGEKCQDVCSLHPCQSGATCQRTNDDVGFKCICPDKYLGQYLLMITLVYYQNYQVSSLLSVLNCSPWRSSVDLVLLQEET